MFLAALTSRSWAVPQSTHVLSLILNLGVYRSHASFLACTLGNTQLLLQHPILAANQHVALGRGGGGF
jgi:hypothetical protein